MNWSKTYLSKDKALVYPYQIKLESRLNGGNDNDLLVHVVKKVELNDELAREIQKFVDDGYLVILMTAGPADGWLREQF